MMNNGKIARKLSPDWSRFVRQYWVLAVIFTVLAVLVTYLMIKLFQSSNLLAEASRKSFSQETKTIASNLDGYFERLRSHVETLAKSKAIHAYYQNKALGMSLEYGLGVAVGEVRDEFERFQSAFLAKGRPISLQIVLFDSKEMRVVTQTQNLLTDKYAEYHEVVKNVQSFQNLPMFTVVTKDAGADAFAVMSVTYKGELKGYLLTRLDLQTIKAEIFTDESQTDHAFYVIVNSIGAVFVGQKKYLGKNIWRSFGINPESQGSFDVMEVTSKDPEDTGQSLIVSGGNIAGTPFRLLRIAPTLQYVPGPATHLWQKVFLSLVAIFIIMLLFIYRSLVAQFRTYRQLQEARDTLETRVTERTSQLAETNELLQREINARSRMEESLRNSEERYRDLFEQASDLIYTMDTKGRLTSVNEVIHPVLGYVPQEFLDSDFRSIIDPQSRPIDQTNFAALIMNDVDHVGPYELLAYSKDNVPVWLEVTSRSIRKNGKPVGIHCIARDITQKKKLEAAILDVQDKYQSVVESFEGLIHITSSNHEIQFANQRLVERTGYDPVGHKCYEAIHGLSEVCSWCSSREMNSEKKYQTELLSPRDERWYHEVSSPLKQQDGSLSRIFLMHDIDDRKRAEHERERVEQQLAQSQKMEAVGTLAGGIAHDFNNLLQVILGYSQLLLGVTSLKPNEYKNVERINIAARHGADLVKGLMAFSRKAVTMPVRLNLNEPVKELMELIQHTIPRMIRVEVSLGAEMPVINADPGQVKQIIMNLALNAADAMPDGGVLTIETRKIVVDDQFYKDNIGAKPGSYCILSVTDTGIGITEEALQHIFEPFYTTKAVGKGAGLGLSMVFGIVRQHGGFIIPRSEQGYGTTISIYLPVNEELPETTPEALPELDIPIGGTETILLVEDEAHVRELAADYLQELGYTILTASNGKNALDVFRQNRLRISLVLLDLIMPEMDGRNCLRELLKIDPKLRVVMVSGCASASALDDTIELGARGFVHKPYDLGSLLSTIRHVLDSP